MTPKVSVILPCYNSERFIAQTLNSISHQTYQEFECIAIDDGSTDDTRNILEAHSAADSRFTIISRQNRGLIQTLNELITMSTCPLIARMDSDDIAHPERLEVQVDEIENRRLSVCGSSTEFFGEKEYGKWPAIESESLIKWLLCFTNPISHPSTIYRKSDVLSVGMYSTAASHVEDYDLWCRMAANGLRIGNTSRTLLKYRTHKEQITRKNIEQIRRNFRESQHEYCKSLGLSEKATDYIIRLGDGRDRDALSSPLCDFPKDIGLSRNDEMNFRLAHAIYLSNPTLARIFGIKKWISSVLFLCSNGSSNLALESMAQSLRKAASKLIP